MANSLRNKACKLKINDMLFVSLAKKTAALIESVRDREGKVTEKREFWQFVNSLDLYLDFLASYKPVAGKLSKAERERINETLGIMINNIDTIHDSVLKDAWFDLDVKMTVIEDIARYG
jgi:hypothetical protein